MTPREPDRYDKQGDELAAAFQTVRCPDRRTLACRIAAALRAAESEALERAAQEILVAFDDACWDGLAERVRTGKWTVEKSNV